MAISRRSPPARPCAGGCLEPVLRGAVFGEDDDAIAGPNAARHSVQLQPVPQSSSLGIKDAPERSPLFAFAARAFPRRLWGRKSRLAVWVRHLPPIPSRRRRRSLLWRGQYPEQRSFLDLQLTRSALARLARGRRSCWASVRGKRGCGGEQSLSSFNTQIQLQNHLLASRTIPAQSGAGLQGRMNRLFLVGIIDLQRLNSALETAGSHPIRSVAGAEPLPLASWSHSGSTPRAKRWLCGSSKERREALRK